MTDLSPEDRERLVEAKFGELAYKFLNSEAGNKWFNEKVQALHEAAGTEPQQQQQQSSPQQSAQTNEKPRRRSLLEQSLSQALGLP